MDNLNTLTAILQANVIEIMKEVRKAEEKAAKAEEKAKNLPETAEDVSALLDALAEAELNCTDHFKRFPREGYEDRYQTDPECQADWHKAHEVRTKAIANLTKFAMARRNA